VTERERQLLRFHAARPGALAAALARTGSYERLAACVPPNARVLDLGCGDGHLLAMLGPRAIGCDLSHDELALARAPVVRARAQALPFAAASCDAVVSHFAFSLFDDIERVIAELARVLAPGGTFAAMLGGGPTADGDDAFHRFLALAGDVVRAAPRFGDPRAKSEAGWRALLDERTWHAVAFARCELDLSGTHDEVWRYFVASYLDVSPALFARWREATRDHARVPCRIVAWLASVQRR